MKTTHVLSSKGVNVLSVLSIYILPYPSPDGGSLRLLEKVTVRCSCRNINQTPEAELRTQPDTDVSRDVRDR